MSIADAVRARALETRVAELERRMLLLEQLRPTSTNSDPSPQAKAFVQNLAQAARAKHVKADDAA